VQTLRGTNSAYPRYTRPPYPSFLCHCYSDPDDAPYLFTSNRKTAIGRGLLWHLMQVYGERAGVPWAKRNFHALRHATATHMLMAGIDVRSVQAWRGHRRIENTLRYLHIIDAHRIETARKMGQSKYIVVQCDADILRRGMIFGVVFVGQGSVDR
jgi:site-specific recombinase XerD